MPLRRESLETTGTSSHCDAEVLYFGNDISNHNPTNTSRLVQQSSIRHTHTDSRCRWYILFTLMIVCDVRVGRSAAFAKGVLGVILDGPLLWYHQLSTIIAQVESPTSYYTQGRKIIGNKFKLQYLRKRFFQQAKGTSTRLVVATQKHET